MAEADVIRFNVLVACSDANGVPTIVPIKWRASPLTIQNGLHYDDIESYMRERGYDGSFVVIDEFDMAAMSDTLKAVLKTAWDDVDIAN